MPIELKIIGAERPPDHAAPLSTELIAWQWGLTMPQNCTTGSASAKFEVRNLTVRKHVDSTSPSLLAYCSSGARLKSVQLDVEQTGPERSGHMRITLYDAVITAVDASGQISEHPALEEVSFAFREVHLEYIDQQRSDGYRPTGWNVSKQAPFDKSPYVPFTPDSDDVYVEVGPEVNTIQFTVYHCREIRPEVWYPLCVYLHEAAVTDAVESDFRHRFHQHQSFAKRRRPSQIAVQQGTAVTIVPEISGCVCNPPSQTLLWLESWHVAEFRLRTSLTGQSVEYDGAVHGRVLFFAESVLIGDVPLFAFITDAPVHYMNLATETARGHAYNSIFVSYSRDDEAIVERVGRAYEALGMEFLRDVVALRSGECWTERLLQLIESADVFQLYWSDRAKASEFVEREWRHALRQPRDNFVRPVYWQKPLPCPPGELAHLHFRYVPNL